MSLCGNEQQQHQIVTTAKAQSEIEKCMVVAFLSLSATAESYWGKTGGTYSAECENITMIETDHMITSCMATIQAAFD